MAKLAADRAVLPLAVMVAVQGASAFQNFLPPLADIRTGADTPTMTTAVRSGEVIAGGMVMLLALTIAHLAESTAPLWIGAATVLYFGGFYEWALRQPPPA